MTQERKDPILNDDLPLELTEPCRLSWPEVKAKVEHLQGQTSEAEQTQDAPAQSEAASAAPVAQTATPPVEELPRNPLTEAEMMFILHAVAPAIEEKVQAVMQQTLRQAFIDAHDQMNQQLKLHVHDAILATLKRVEISRDEKAN